MAVVAQPLKGRVVQVAAPGLEDRRLVGRQAEGVEGGQDGGGRTGNLARGIDVFDAHEPFATGVAGDEPAAHGGHERAEMQGAGGGGSEAPAVTFICHPVPI